MKIFISTDLTTIPIELFETYTAKKIHSALRIESIAETWGDEIYLETPVTALLETGAEAECEIGTVGYWPPGKAFCVFFGRTPASTNEKPRAASPINVIGKIIGPATIAKKIISGQRIIISTTPPNDKNDKSTGLGNRGEIIESVTPSLTKIFPSSQLAT